MGKDKKIVGISGASGFIGGHLSQWLADCGHLPIPISRKVLDGDPRRLEQIVADCDVVINLAGAPINRRWSETYKHTLRQSRIEVTQKLVSAINSTHRTEVLISASAIGLYPSDGRCHTEADPEVASTFLAQLCSDWETEAHKVRQGVRLAITRFGIVFSEDGGAYAQIARPYRSGVGIRVGHKSDALSWIAMDDLKRIMQRIVEDTSLEGTFNLTAPEPISIAQMDRLLAQHYNVWCTIAIPSWILRLLLGEYATVLTSSLKVIPQRLVDLHYPFTTPTLNDFLKQLSEPPSQQRD